MSKRERLESDLSDLQKECNSLKTLTKRQEQALAKKEKQLQEQSEEMNSYRAIQEQIFNLSKKNVAK